MRKILIVDDEQPVAFAIAHIIRRDFPREYELSGTASSGREAIEKVSLFSPDIILMDVRMPGFSGLEAIREMRSRGSDAAFILITAYERFEIAREAIDLGVVDYLLKPVTSEALALSLKMAIAYLGRRDEFERSKLESREWQEKSRLFAEKALLYGIMAGDAASADMKEIAASLDCDSPRMMALCLAFANGHTIVHEDVEATFVHRKISSILRYKTDFLISPLVAGQCLVFIPLRSPNDADTALSMFALALESVGDMSGRFSLVFGRGGVRPIEEAGISWHEAMIDLYRKASDSPTPPEPGKDATEKALFDAIVENSLPQARRLLDAYCAAHRAEAAPSSSERCSMIALMGSTILILERRGQLQKSEVENLMAMNDLYSTPDRASYGQAVRARASIMIEACASAPQSHSPTVLKAMAYVRLNYANSISLETVAREIGISPNRLSRLFIEETGRGFSHFLVAHRVSKAREMLAQPGLSVKEVSMKCGYPDQNYFARLFKKMTGSTPSSILPNHDGGFDESS